MSALTREKALRRYYIRIAFVLVSVLILASVLEYRSSQREQALRQEVIRSTVRQILDAIK